MHKKSSTRTQALFPFLIKKMQGRPENRGWEEREVESEKTMALTPPQVEEDDEYTMVVERKDQWMISPSGNWVPTLKCAHFLKPLLNPSNQTLPKLPSSFTISSNPNLFNVTREVQFKGRPMPLKAWKTWVKILQQTHQNLWKELGIFDAVRASTYYIKMHNELIIGLAEKWCSETNTFIFPWGESTVTLEDVMILGGFSVLGVSVVASCENSRGFDEMEANLLAASGEIRRVFYSASQTGWMNHFKGKGGEIEHVAFLVLWLSKFVFSTNSSHLINRNVFGIAIRLAKGVKVALAHAVLASIYRDLTLLKARIVGFTEGKQCYSDLVLWAPFQIVQLWFWERFPKLSPKPYSLMLGEPRLARWHRIDKLPIKNLMEEIESAGNTFLWRPYTTPLQNWEFPRFYSENGRWECINSEVDDRLLSFATCLRVCDLEGMDCLEQYNPHRVGMQFGMDQDIPGSPSRSNGNVDPAWISYMPLDDWKLYLPPRAINGEVTVSYCNWWKAAYFGHNKPEKVMEFSHDLKGKLVGVDDRKCVTFGDEKQGNRGNIVLGINDSASDQSVVASGEVAPVAAGDLMLIEDDDDDEDDSVTQFLKCASSIEDRVRRLENTIRKLKSSSK